MSKDIVITIVPFLQEQHADYVDYWRFTPQTIDRLFKKNNMDLIYISYNDSSKDSIYIFAIGSKKKDIWSDIFNNRNNKISDLKDYRLALR